MELEPSAKGREDFRRNQDRPASALVDAPSGNMQMQPPLPSPVFAPYFPLCTETTWLQRTITVDKERGTNMQHFPLHKLW